MILDLRFAICDLADRGPSLSLTPLSLTPRFSGVENPLANWNRFSGFKGAVQTAKAVQAKHHHRSTLLKQGVNEIRKFRFWIPLEVPSSSDRFGAQP